MRTFEVVFEVDEAKIESEGETTIVRSSEIRNVEADGYVLGDRWVQFAVEAGVREEKDPQRPGRKIEEKEYTFPFAVAADRLVSITDVTPPIETKPEDVAGCPSVSPNGHDCTLVAGHESPHFYMGDQGHESDQEKWEDVPA